MGNNWGRAYALRELGDAQRIRAKYVDAEALYIKVLATYNSIGDDLGGGDALRGLDDVQQSLFKYAEAESPRSPNLALVIYKSIGNDLGRGNALRGRGNVQEALSNYSEALATFESIGNDWPGGRVNDSLKFDYVKLAMWTRRICSSMQQESRKNSVTHGGS